MIQSKELNIVVVGAGHAGCEAALAAARMGVQTALVTMSSQTIARMSCNPAIGGLEITRGAITSIPMFNGSKLQSVA